MVKKLIALLLIGCHFIFAVDKVLYPEKQFEEEAPWLTGPLVAPSSVTVAPGSWNIQPYFSATAYTGVYNQHWQAISSDTFWSMNLQIPIQVGILSWMDLQINPSVSWNYTEHQAAWALSDLPIALDIQLYNNKFIKGDWIPSIKLVLREVLPIGKYDRLDPKKLLTDAGGLGSWVTGVGIVFGKLFHFGGVHFMNARFTVQYNLPSKVNLRGFNFYGGGIGSRAKYFPSQNFFVDLGLEVTLAQRWALAFDLVANYFTKAHYSGFPGLNPNGSLAYLNTVPKIQYSIAPALEYNWRLIAGAWFTVAGRNSLQFFSGIISLNYSR